MRMNAHMRIVITAKMKRSGLIILCLVFIVAVGAAPIRRSSAENSSSSAAQSGALTREELATQIQVKAKQLEDINQQLESTKQNLKNTKGEGVTLQKELRGLQGNINQLNLNIKSDEITIQKLGLEIDSLNYDLVDIQASVKDKKGAIENVLRELQKNDRVNNNLLLVFLRNGSLADGALEAQSLNNLQNQLTLDVANLRNLQDEYNKKINDVDARKDQIDFRHRDLTNKKLIVEDQKEERQTVLEKTKNKESVFQKQVAELEKLQQQIANEVEAMDAVLRTKIDPSLLPPLKPGVLAMPLAVSKDFITQDYGATSFAKYGYQGKWHNGIDIGSPVGTPVLAAEEGTVVAVGNQDAYCYRGAYGKFIVIRHKNNLATLYAHLSRQIVAKGDAIKRGQIIGYSGSTGYSTGPHLHFIVYADPTFYMGISKTCGPMPHGGDLNPLGYL